jgi:hypothetical protein
MYFLLLIVSFIATTLCLFLRYEARNGPYTAIRISFLISLILHAVIIFFYNEIFSYFNLITPLTARIYWFIVALATSGWLAYTLQGRTSLRQLFDQIGSFVRLIHVDGRSRFLVYTGLALLILPLLALALYAPPNNYDSHHYHLSRVLYWLADQNLDHFPTMHVQQLYHNVFAEYLILHSFLLVGSDQLANLFQFGAMLGSVVAVSLLGKCLGLTYRGQLLAGILMACLPIGMFESTTTQNDYVACFFFISFVLFGYWFLDRPNRLTMVWCLLALVFGGFTKYTILFFALPFVLYFACIIIKKRGFLFGVGTLAGAVLLFGLIFAPFFSRNYEAFGSIMSPKEDARLVSEKIPVDKFSVPYSISNVIKNAGLHIGLPYPPYNRQAESVVAGIHHLLGVSLSEPAISKDVFTVKFSMQEDMAPNTFHFFLLLIAALILFFHRGHWSAKLMFGLGLLGFVLFSSTFKFQQFSSRTHMPFFAIGCVISAYTFQAVLKRTGFYLILVLYVLSLTVVLGNPGKMVVPIRYLGKRLAAYIPSSICSESPKQRQLFQQVLGPYYVHTSTSYAQCFAVRQAYTYNDRRTIFHKLDSIGYYKHDKEESILFESRAQAYFANHTNEYDDYAPLLPYVGPDVQNIAMMFNNDSGFYHYWSALSQQVDHPIRMAYNRYFNEYTNLPNAKRPFCYNYILTNDVALVHELIKPDDIADMHSSGKLILIHLKQPSCQTYQF